MPSTVYWVGIAPIVRNVLSFACAAPTIGVTRSVTYNGRTVSVVTVTTSAADLAAQLYAAIQASTDARVRDGTPAVSGTTLTITGPADGAPLTSPAGSTGVVLTNTAGTGPYHADNVANYSTGGLPANGDTLEFQYGAANEGPRYGLTALTAVTLAKLIVRATFLGRMGLTNFRQTYTEFRPKFFESAAAAFEIYSNTADQDERLKIKATSAAATTWRVQGAGTAGTNGWPLEVQGPITTSTFVATNYGVSFASEPDALAVLASVLGNTCNFNKGVGATIALLKQTGGNLTVAGQVAAAQLINVAARTVLAGNMAGIDQDAGSILWQSSASPTTHDCINGGSIDYSLAAAVITLPATSMTAGCTLVEGDRLARPWSVVHRDCAFGDLNIVTSAGGTSTWDN